jgi:CBS domain containing-hemolysin-like protein
MSEAGRSEDSEHRLVLTAGFVLSQFGRLPDIGESFESQGWRFEIVDLDRRRIDKILAQRIATGLRRAAV